MTDTTVENKGMNRSLLPIAPSRTGVLNLSIKVTRACNLRCNYCSDWRSSTDKLELDRIEHLIDVAVRTSRYAKIRFNWHGGEPTLVPVDYYEAAVELQRQAIRPGQQIFNSIQTNGYHLTSRWLDFLQQSDFVLGVSLDGPRETQDSQRLTAAQRPTFDRVMGTIDAIRSRNIPFGVIMVITDDMVKSGPVTIWEFIKEHRFTDVEFIPARPPNLLANGRTLSPQMLTSQAYEEFLGGVFDLWWRERSPVRIRILDALLRKIAGGASPVCLVSGDCHGSVFGIEPDGTIMHCDEYQEDEKYALGNIGNLDFATLPQSEKYQVLIAENEERLNSYRQCEHFDICSGGCPHDSYLAQRYEGTRATQKCCGYGPLIKHMLAEVGDELKAR